MTRKRIFFAMACISAAAPASAETSWTIQDEQRLSAIVPNCSGGEYGDKGLRTAQMIAASLPKAGEAAALLGSQRADDIYLYAGALLKPRIVNAERALDAVSSITCPADPQLGVRLMEYLAGEQPGRNFGPNNVFYWLGIASRRGVGTPANPALARQYFLKARILGIWKVTAEDWGSSPSDDLLTIARKPENFRWIEEAAANGKQDAGVLLAQLIVSKAPARARSLLSAQPDNLFAARALAEFEMAGKFGAPHPDEAVRVLARFGRLNKPYYDLMLQAARQHNGSDDIPVSPRKATLEELGGEKLLLEGKKQQLDAVRGVITTRALVDPNGTIVYTELIDPQSVRFRMASATLNVFSPRLLNKVPPLASNGRNIFHWITLPAIRWGSPTGAASIQLQERAEH